MRRVHMFNQDWLYTPRAASASEPDSAFAPITLPHTNIVLPHTNFDNSAYQFISTYRKHFALPEPRQGRRVFLDFDGALLAAEVFLNGIRLGDHEGGFTPFSFDITDALRDGTNALTVRLDSTERPDIPPYGFIVDYLTFGGIYRDVTLRYVAPVFVEHYFVRASQVLTAPHIEVDVWVHNRNSGESACTVGVQFGTNAEAQTSVTIAPNGTKKVTLAFDLAEVPLWSLEQPQRVPGVVRLLDAGQETDRVEGHWGFREAVFRPEGFFLNGQKIKLRGLNRHQIYPFIGAAAPARLQRKDADILKYELGCNIVRTSHYPQSPHFIQRCDEIGLLVFEEIPGWQHIGDNDWQGIALRDVEAMIMRDRNHPSIILWGVRINESQDNEVLYRATNDLARRLDPTRQTGGVRFFQDSQFLEDVFTLNDFSNTIVQPQHQPHLVTEYLGHMFPTKTWDGEERQVEHALRHARIQDAAYGNDAVTGAIGWCMFDYNTHVEFGSGDRVCYHGVLDMFRLPKFAAYLYESQINPAERIVLRPATFYAFGDRSNGGADNDFDFYVFSNCDEVQFYVGDDLWGTYQPDRAAFPHLPYAPFKIGNGWLWYAKLLRVPDGRLVGYRDGQIMAEERLAANKLPQRLILQPDDAELLADGADMTRLVFKVVDAAGHRLPHAHAAVTFSLTGPGELVGTNPFVLVGGQAALYLRARHERGMVTITATTPGLPPAQATVMMI